MVWLAHGLGLGGERNALCRGLEVGGLGKDIDGDDVSRLGDRGVVMVIGVKLGGLRMLSVVRKQRKNVAGRRIV